MALGAFCAAALAGCTPAGLRRESFSGPECVPASPRTLPQALGDYWRRLHSPLEAEDADRGASPKGEGNGDNGSGRADAAKGNGGEDKPRANNNGDKEDAEDKSKNDEKSEAKDEEKKPDWYSAHGQTTVVTQTHDRFHSPYAGTNSLRPVEGAPTSLTGTLYFDVRLWERPWSTGEVIFNPELAGGRGLSGTMGVAGFPNGEITRVGALEPTPYIARCFLRNTIGFGGEREKVEDDLNQIAGERDVNRLTISIGKMAATDFVDDNRYSHDPREQFLNWSLMYNGAWDYPANVRGYTYGFAFDYNTKNWAFRYGLFLEPSVANGAEVDPHVLRANGHVWEWEERHTLCDHPGKLRFLAFLNHAHMGNYDQAVALTGPPPDITQTRAYRIKYGFATNLEQELTRDLGLFARLGWNDGHSESWAFTEIDRTAALGLVLKGTRWRRPKDQIGVAYVFNRLSPEHRDYLAAGGLGFIIGDGALRYGVENVLETYYSYVVNKGIILSADFQEVTNPAYNRDRGPVSIGAIRVHVEF
jgi:high affinity Mn2+ porin